MNIVIAMSFISLIRRLASRVNIQGVLVVVCALFVYLAFRIQYTYSFLVDDVYQVQPPRELYVSERFTIRYAYAMLITLQNS